MAVLKPGAKAPDFISAGTDGQTYSLGVVLKKGPAVLFFYKRECPVCQMAAPFVERFQQAYAGDRFTMLGVAQNDAEETREFASQFGVTFPILLDSNGYRVSKAYGLTNVPTTFLVDPSGVILQTVQAWDRAKLNEMSAKVAELTGRPVVPISIEGDGAPDFRPG
ncbi:MAG: peroxiredoxin family protein [Armatimonadota bacterium]